jgi:hypothetical protein
MSIGNLKDYGNKGNNFPFQLKVLQGITNILAAMTGTSIVINPKVRTANIKRSDSTGTVAAGTFSASISNTGSANATVNLIPLKPGETINFDAGALNNTLNAISYDATGTEVLIIWVAYYIKIWLLNLIYH